MTQPANLGGGGTEGESLLGGIFGAPVQAVNADPYNNLLSQAAANSQAYANEGMTYGQAAPTISNPYQAASQATLNGVQSNLGQVGALDMATAQGRGPALAALTAANTQAADNSIASQTAMARSATGGATQQAAAQLAAMGNASQIQGNAAAQNVQNLANAELGAAGQAAGVYGTQGSLAQAQYAQEQQNAQQQAQLQLANQGQVNSQQLGLGNLGLQSGNQALATANGYNNAVATAEGAANNAGAQGFSQLQALANSASGGAGAAAMFSDERVKHDIRDEGDRKSMADDFLDHLRPHSYNYDDPSQEPRSEPTGGKYLGIMAQDLVSTRGVGPQLVSNTPRGMTVETKPTLSAALAGLGRLNERLRTIEAERGNRGR